MRICWWLLFVCLLKGPKVTLQADSFRSERSLDYRDSNWMRNNLTNYLNNNNDKLPEVQCCVCDEAKYELVFEALWSKHTHPDEFPENGWLAKFGDIIGASHSSEFRMWQEDSYASDGVKELAETGGTKKLEAELKQVSSKTRTIIKARELHNPTLNSKTSAVFRADRMHHLVSILSKLSPSPDWMVGVSGLELCQSDCSWAQQRTVDLYLWDAGTDSGQSFEAPDSPTRPPEKIRPFGFGGGRRSEAENSAGSNQKSSQSASQPKPFARLTITRQRIYEKSCNDDSSSPMKPALSASSIYWPSSEPSLSLPQQQTTYADCRLSEWSDWSSCSSRCGKGLRTRTRTFLDERALQLGCSRADLVNKEVCISECQGSNVCVTHDWGEWSECSVSCGKGLRKRIRAPIDPLKRGCEDVELAELEPCTGIQGANCSSDPTGCEVSDWSHWSECSVACGKGTRIRTRQYQRRGSMENCNVKLLQKQACQGRPELCKHSTKVHSQTCSLPPETGPCKAAFPSWYFDKTKGTCAQFIYGGCLGNSNRFYNLQECQNSCSSSSPPRELAKRSVDSDQLHNNSLSKPSPSSLSHTPEECLLPLDTGLGRPLIKRWYFNQERHACLMFVWGGFMGNSNNFEHKIDCEEFCLGQSEESVMNPEMGLPKRPIMRPVSSEQTDYDYEEKDYDEPISMMNNSKKVSYMPELCDLPADPGPCRAAIKRWYYVAEQRTCKRFLYGGCEGNENKFKLLEQCEEMCIGKTRRPKPVSIARGLALELPAKCHLPKDSGTCRALSIYWGYDQKSGRCTEFAYGGCKGNDNRFSTKDECERICDVARHNKFS